MKGGTRAAMALGVGYVLGRRRKMRMATMLAVATAAGGVGSLGSAAVKRGTKALGSGDALGKVAPQLGGIVDTVRGELVDAGKAAAIAAVNSRVESLTDSLHERAEAIREPAAAAAGAAGAGGSAGEKVRAPGRRRRRADDEEDDRQEDRDDDGDDDREEAAEDEDAAEYEDDDEYEDEDDEYEDEDDEEPEPEPEPAPRRTARRRPPVARTRR